MEKTSEKNRGWGGGGGLKPSKSRVMPEATTRKKS